MNPDLKDHMLALGVLITNFNKLESSLFFLFYHFLGTQAVPVSLFIFSKLNNLHRIDAIQKYIDEERDVAVKNRLEYFVRSYNICTENRNFLAHAQLHRRHLTLADLGLTEPSPTHAVFKKPPRKSPERENFTHLTVAELRQIADDTETADNFCFDMYLYLHARKTGGVFTFPSGKMITPALPEMSDLPRALILSDSGDHRVEQPHPGPLSA